jgi:four helix bundle protein
MVRWLDGSVVGWLGMTVNAEEENMAYERLEDLRVYQMAFDIGENIWDQIAEWKYFEKDVVGRQLAGAADSISANIAESYGRTGTKDVISFLIYSRGSLYETKDRLRKAIRRKLISPEQGAKLQRELESLAPTLNACITAKRKSLRDRPTT